MNFYEAQDDARRRTKWLIVYFVLAVIGVIVAVYSLVGFVLMNQGGSYYTQNGEYIGTHGSWWDLDVFIRVSIATTAVILLGTIFKSLQLAEGGVSVARDMGGRPVDPHTTDLDERKLIHVVEEMAIATGLPVPQVWIMDDEVGINAFAAGTEPGNAVIGVTRGCVQHLTRGELQGVIAHEFSHILNGDMKLNMRLIGWLFGIMMLSILGRILLHSLRFVRIRSSSRDNNGVVIVIAMLLAGVGLLVIGSIGVFFARMIQAAISRQREFLADASAVEFTRDPSGIAGALKKIGGQEVGGRIFNAKAGEASHMFFADGGMFSYGFSTHPPLEVRIAAIEESWDGKFKEVKLPPVADRGQGRGASSAVSMGLAGAAMSENSDVAVDSREWRDVGEASANDVAVGAAIHAGLLEEWVAAVHDREFAQALIFGLLLAEDDEVLTGEVSFLEKTAGAEAAKLSVQWQKTLQGIHSSKKIALIDLSIPTLRRLTLPEYERFIEITRWLIASDGQVDLFEFMLQRMLERHLDVHFYGSKKLKVKYTRLSQLRDEANILLTTMAGIGARSQEEVEQAYRAATKDLVHELGGEIELLPPEKCGLQALEKALAKVELATAMVKKQLIYACGLAVMNDGVLESREAEMLRAVADSIGCAIPPFVKI